MFQQTILKGSTDDGNYVLQSAPGEPNTESSGFLNCWIAYWHFTVLTQ